MVKSFDLCLQRVRDEVVDQPFNSDVQISLSSHLEQITGKRREIGKLVCQVVGCNASCEVQKIDGFLKVISESDTPLCE